MLEFRDGSTLELGPNSNVQIDKFVFNPVDSVSEKSVRVTQGLFRYTSAFVSKSSLAEIKTPTATMGIRGSVAVGAVPPPGSNQPSFFAMPSGNGTLTTQGGSAPLGQGGAAAVAPGGNSPPATNLPPAVVAQAFQVVTNVMGQVAPPLPPASQQQLAANAQANLQPVAAQRTTQALVPTTQSQTQTGGSAAPPALTLLNQANAVGLLNNAPGAALSPNQAAFVNQVNAQNPNAAAQVQTFTQQNQIQNQVQQQSGTQTVISNVSLIAPANQVVQMVQNSVAANQQLAGLITQTAVRNQPGAAVQIVQAAASAAPGQAGQIAQAGADAAPGQSTQLAQAAVQGAAGVISTEAGPTTNNNPPASNPTPTNNAPPPVAENPSQSGSGN